MGIDVAYHAVRPLERGRLVALGERAQSSLRENAPLRLAHGNRLSRPTRGTHYSSSTSSSPS